MRNEITGNSEKEFHSGGRETTQGKREREKKLMIESSRDNGEQFSKSDCFLKNEKYEYCNEIRNIFAGENVSLMSKST